MNNVANHLVKYQKTVDDTLNLLNQNLEWRSRYVKYANDISANLDNIKQFRSTFHEWPPLYVYINITNAKNAKSSVIFQLRYLGQTVANLSVKKEIRMSTAGFDEKNKRDFDCILSLKNAEWNGDAAQSFRKHFRSRSSFRNLNSSKRNEEHRIESMMLTEFSRVDNKKLRHIKPVLIGGIRVSVPTPVSASNHGQIKYSGISGGCIDILARTGTGKATNLCIMELKDENNTKEPPQEAMKQAVAYATFVRELLRSDAGPGWWKLMGFGGVIPDQLTLYATVVMPFGNNPDNSFTGIKLPIQNDVIELHYLYFDESQNSVSTFDSSLKLK